jgi:hypothetical protein
MLAKNNPLFDLERLERDRCVPISQQLESWLELITESNDSTKVPYSYQMEEREIKILMASQTNDYPGRCIAIRTVCLPEEIQGKGWFKSFITLCCKINPWQDVIVEDVKNPILLSFLQRMQCEIVSQSYNTTYIINKTNIDKLKASPLGKYSDYQNIQSR